MTSIHLYNATKKDIQNIYNLLVEYKETDLANANYPAIDKNKLLNFILLEKKKNQHSFRTASFNSKSIHKICY